MFMHLAVKSLSSGEAAAIVLCCSAVLVGVMITIIVVLAFWFILKKKQLQAIQTSNSEHIIQCVSTSMSTANTVQQTQETFHYAQNDEVSSAVECYCAEWLSYTNCRSLAILSAPLIMTALSSLQ